jgi:hypothetical protein
MRIAMDLPIRFPDEAEKIYREALAFRQLTPSERFLAIMDLIGSGEALLEKSPHREAGLRLRQAQEAEWRAMQKELFARHGC